MLFQIRSISLPVGLLALVLSVLSNGAAIALQDTTDKTEKSKATQKTDSKSKTDDADDKETPAKGSSSKGSASKKSPAKALDKSTKQDRAAARKRGDITFDDLAFDAEKGEQFENEMLTDEIKELDKRKIKIRGYILPTSVFQQKGIEQFILVRDNQECCFGPGAAIYDCIIVDVIKKSGATFTTRPVTVTGEFEIDTETYKYPDGPHFAIYKMSATEVK